MTTSYEGIETTIQTQNICTTQYSHRSGKISKYYCCMMCSNFRLCIFVHGFYMRYVLLGRMRILHPPFDSFEGIDVDLVCTLYFVCDRVRPLLVAITILVL